MGPLWVFSSHWHCAEWQGCHVVLVGRFISMLVQNQRTKFKKDCMTYVHCQAFVLSLLIPITVWSFDWYFCANLFYSLFSDLISLVPTVGVEAANIQDKVRAHISLYFCFWIIHLILTRIHNGSTWNITWQYYGYIQEITHLSPSSKMVVLIVSFIESFKCIYLPLGTMD